MTNILITLKHDLPQKLTGLEAGAPTLNPTTSTVPLHNSTDPYRLSLASLHLPVCELKCVCVTLETTSPAPTPQRKNDRRERALEVKDEAGSSVMFQKPEHDHLELTPQKEQTGINLTGDSLKTKYIEI